MSATIRSRTAFRARVFAPVVDGPNWQPLLQCVHAHALSEARRHGFGTVVVNEDVGSAVATALTSSGKGEPKTAPRAPTSFWQKALTAVDGQKPLAALATDAFFDPRDI